VTKHKFLVIDSIQLTQPIFAIPIGYLFFGEGDWHWYFYLVLTVAGLLFFVASLQLQLRLGFPARLSPKSHVNRRLYEYIGAPNPIGDGASLLE
jgi:cell division protein FtsW (lipid II flippase)